MKKYKIEVQWHYKAFDYGTFEVEAKSFDEAKEKVLDRAERGGMPDSGGWSDGNIYDGEYYVNDDECTEV